MGGVAPKPANLRQRRNKKTTAAKLTDTNGDAEIPDLPEIREWNQYTQAYWEEIWTSPMATEYIDADYDGILQLIILVDDFYEAESPTMRIKLATEMRLQREQFGLAPIARARLHWEIARGDEAEERRAKRKRPESTPQKAEFDPRQLLGGDEAAFPLRALKGGKL